MYVESSCLPHLPFFLVYIFFPSSSPFPIDPPFFNLSHKFLLLLFQLFPATYPLQMTNVVELKVGLHCDECIKKILKAIKKIQDIETYDVDTQLNKVTVTGNITTEQVIRVIHKIGKTAFTWDDDSQSQLNQQHHF